MINAARAYLNIGEGESEFIFVFDINKA